MSRLLLSLLLAPAILRAVVLIGDDESDNLLRAPDGAPWAYAAEMQNLNGGGDYETRGTGVYLGGGYMLTAWHVSTPARSLLPSGAYATDATFTPVQVGIGDLRLFKILNPPPLPTLPLARPTDADTNRASTILGAGVGRGFAVAGQGWTWGSDQSRLRRWGLNTTLAATLNAGRYLQTTFDLPAGPEEAHITTGDSGSGLFQNFGGTWKLAGIAVSVETAAAYYDNDATTPGDQPDHGYYERIRFFRATLLALTGLPDPATALESWRHFHFGTTAGIGLASNTADGDADGLKNAVEFAFGLDPKTPDADALPQPTLDAGTLTYAFDKPASWLGGATYGAEYSTTLTAWTPLPDEGSGVHHRFVAPTGSAGFVRLKVTLP